MKWLEQDRAKLGSGDDEVATQNVWELGCSATTSWTPHRSQHTANQVVVLIVSSIGVAAPYDGAKDQDHMEETQSVQILHHSWAFRQGLHRTPSYVLSIWGWQMCCSKDAQTLSPPHETDLPLCGVP